MVGRLARRKGEGRKGKSNSTVRSKVRTESGRGDIQLHHQRHCPIRSQHDRAGSIPIPVIASNDQPTRHQQGEEKSSAEEIQEQRRESEPVEFSTEVDQACEAREGHGDDAEDREEDGLGGAVGEEEGEADGPDDGEDAAEGASWWAGEGVGVVLHCDG